MDGEARGSWLSQTCGRKQRGGRVRYGRTHDQMNLGGWDLCRQAAAVVTGAAGGPQLSAAGSMLMNRLALTAGMRCWSRNR
jgi:hypothetical protein